MRGAIRQGHSLDRVMTATTAGLSKRFAHIVAVDALDPTCQVAAVPTHANNATGLAPASLSKRA
jgi:hypothetical protein